MWDLINLLFHLDKFVIHLISTWGAYSYALLFCIIFSETGFIIFPFLPGDSLLFVTGSFCAQPETPLQIVLVFFFLTLASIAGNQINFNIGRYLERRDYIPHWINPQYLQQAKDFYKQHGGKAIFLARFLPIIRTFVPFAAGLCNMSASWFILANILSAPLWIGSMLSMGYLLGHIAWIQAHFTLIIYFILIVSLLPAMIAWLRTQYSSQ